MKILKFAAATALIAGSAVLFTHWDAARSATRQAPDMSCSIEQMRKNQQLVLEFAKAAGDGGTGIEERAHKFLTAEYLQHDPLVASGRDSFIAFFKDYFARHPDEAAPHAMPAPEMVTADCNHVALMWKIVRPNPQKPGATYDSYFFDAWRIENGKLAEHWDSQLIGADLPPQK